MSKTVIAFGAAVFALVAEPLAVSTGIALATFYVVLAIGRENRLGSPAAKVYIVYRYDFDRHARESIGQIPERRRSERGNNHRDLSRLAQARYCASSQNSLVFLSVD